MTDARLVNRAHHSNADGNEFQRSAERCSSPNSSTPTPNRRREHRYKNMLHLWEFLLELLADESCRSIICWKKKESGVFKLIDHHEVAKRWGMLKQKDGMDYSKLSRALRLYYQQGIIRKVKGEMLVYRFNKLPYKYEPGVTRSQYQEQFQRISQNRHQTPERKAKPFTLRSSPATSAFVTNTSPLGKGFSWPVGSMPSPQAYWYPEPLPCLTSLSFTKSTRIFYPVPLSSEAVGLRPTEINHKTKGKPW